MSVINFWQGVFPLPSDCLKEIQNLCAAFLWDGPNLNPRKVKISWSNLCYPKEEGGLGFRSLKDSGKVHTLKIIWRLLSSRDSLWADWVREYLMQGMSFWSYKSVNAGSWIFRKMLKLRNMAKNLHRVELVTGMQASFWFDNWNGRGQLFDVCGARGTIELGVPKNATVQEACNKIRRRRHRNADYNEIQKELIMVRNHLKSKGSDIQVWKQESGEFEGKFITKSTWKIIRQVREKVEWEKSVWFKKATPKHSFIHWLACLGKLATKDRTKRWNSQVNSDCLFCNGAEETRNHLFLECQYSASIWSNIMKNFMGRSYTTDWEELQVRWRRYEKDKVRMFLFQYALQVTIYNIWLERNRRVHGKPGKMGEQLSKMIKKEIKNRITAGREELKGMHKDTMQVWLRYEE